ncbi:MAG: hypothetical protein NT062_03090 [Proteobacteria bacterium]|nr:hypothetical protein [Pseudomonadota bacterium]
MTLSWGLQPQDRSTQVFLAATDERGAQVSHPIGTFPGTCGTITPAPELHSLLSVSCKDGATGVQIDVVARPDRVIVTRMRIDDGVAPDPTTREQLAEIMAPDGAKIEAQTP